jgi:hypothetical protein
MFTLVFNSYANNEINISLKKMQYAMNNPGIPIVVAEEKSSIMSSNWLWVEVYRTKKLIVFQRNSFLDISKNYFTEFNQTETIGKRFCWELLPLLFFGILGAVTMARNASNIVYPVICLFMICFWNENASWQTKTVIGILFIACEILGRFLKENKLLKKLVN